MCNMEKTMGQILKRLAIRSVSYEGMTRALLPFLIVLLVVSCSTQSSEEKSAEVRFREMAVESGAVVKDVAFGFPQPRAA